MDNFNEKFCDHISIHYLQCNFRSKSIVRKKNPSPLNQFIVDLDLCTLNTLNCIHLCDHISN